MARAEATQRCGKLRAGRLGGLVLCFWLASTAAADPPAAQEPLPIGLVADRIEIDAEAGRVTAAGAVEVVYDGRTLRAARIVYEDRTGTIYATGPIELFDGQGNVALADEAELQSDLVDGLVRNARLLIAGELQVAAVELRRSEGRYTTLFDTVASSCEVCAGDRVPTWAIRAERIIRDTVEQRIHFRNATLEVFGIPVGWLPYLRIPDPAVERASGFLVPQFRRSQIYGAGLKLPYYVVLGPSADVTMTPFMTERAGMLLEGEVRRRFSDGAVQVGGVLQIDNRLDDRRGRGALSATGDLGLGRGFRFEFEANAVTDDQFLEQFDYSSSDRLTSAARIVRTRANDYLEAGTVAFQSLRLDEASETIPFVVPEITYRRLWADGPFGGRLAVEVDALGLVRETGRDVVRFGGTVDWRRERAVGPGLLVAGRGRVDVDAYEIGSADPGDSSGYRRVAPTLEAELRWPLTRADRGGAIHVIEPVAHVAWTEAIGDDAPPNEDSQLPEFDTTNLFAANRFPGRDRIETGLRAGVGIGYLRRGAGGWSLGASAGRVVRLDTSDEFARGTGLGGRASDWVGAVSITVDGGGLAEWLDGAVTATNRVRLGNELGIRRNEFGLLYSGPRADLGAAYVYLASDASNPDLGPQARSSEVALDGRYRFLPNWRAEASLRYDFTASRPIRAGAGLVYGTECAEIDLSLSRRFVSSANVPPSTSVGFAVRLVGLGAAGSADWPRRVCNG